jgi:hypothetical protein
MGNMGTGRERRRIVKFRTVWSGMKRSLKRGLPNRRNQFL